MSGGKWWLNQALAAPQLDTMGKHNFKNIRKYAYLFGNRTL
jgi:hypothetical protein